MFKENEITEKIIGCSYKVANTLGCGFLEKVYENALFIELKKNGLFVVQQQPLMVFYEDEIVGNLSSINNMMLKVLIEGIASARSVPASQ